MSPVFFTDRDLGKRFPKILREKGIVVECHVDHFQPDAADVDWIPEVARRGWVVLSNDKKILRNDEERNIVMRSGLALLLVVGGHAQIPHLAMNFVNTYPVVEQFVKAHTPPYIAKIYRPSPVSDVALGIPGNIVLKWPRQ